MKKHFLLLALAAICSLSVWAVDASWRMTSLPGTGGEEINGVTLKPLLAPRSDCNLFGAWGQTAYVFNDSQEQIVTISTNAALQLKEITVSIAFSTNTFVIEFYDGDPAISGDMLSLATLTGSSDGAVESPCTIDNIPAGAHFARITDKTPAWNHYLYDVQVTTETAVATNAITYKSGDGQGADVIARKAIGASYTLPTIEGLGFTCADHILLGWKSSADDQVYPAGTEMTMGTTDITYTAQWLAGAAAAWRMTSLPGTGGQELNGITLTPTVAPSSGCNLFGAWNKTGYIFNSSPVQELTISTGDALQLYEVTVSIATPDATPNFLIEFYDDPTGDVVSSASLTGSNDGSIETPCTIKNIPAGAHFARITDKSPDWNHYLYDIKVTASEAAAVTKYTATFLAGGAEGTVPAAISKEAEKTYTLPVPTNLSKTGNVFKGWKYSVDDHVYAAGTEMTMGTADVTYTAQWEVGVTATWRYQGGGGDEELPNANWPSEVNGITLMSSFSPNNAAYIMGGNNYVYNYEFGGADNAIDITAPSGQELKNVTTSINFLGGAGSVKIYFSEATAFDATQLVGDPVALTGSTDQNTELPCSIDAPDGALSARIHQDPTGWGPFLYSITVSTRAITPVTKHTASFLAGGAEGTVPAAKSVGENKTYKLPEPTNLVYDKHVFIGWKYSADDQVYPAGTEMTMGTADVTYTAQWEEQSVPMVTNLQIVGAENNIVPLSFMIPGIVDLSNPVAPLASSSGDPTYSYDATTDVATATGTAIRWEQYGMAFNIGSVSNIETVSFEYLGQENGDVNLWAGACDASHAYWEQGVTHAISTSFQTTSVRPNQMYWADGGVANPLPFAVPQVAIYANAGNDTYANHTFSVRNVRYHVKDAIDVDHIVITRRLSTEGEDAAVQIYTGTKSAFTDNTITAAGTYVYAVYCYDADGNASDAATISYEYTPATTYAVTYLAGAEDVTGDLPTEPEHIEGGKFSVAAATGLKRLGYTFVGWNDGTTTYQPNAEYTMPGAPVKFTAQWEAVVVPTISNLQIKNADDNIVPISWYIPGIVDLSNPVTPLVQSSGDPTYSYDAATDVATATGTSVEYNQCGIAFNIGSVTNLESISYSYTGTVNDNVDLWAGVCDASYAYWQSGQTVHPTTTEQNVSSNPNMKYWAEGGVTNPLSFAVSQVAIYANSGAGTHDNQVFSVSNVRYHVKDAIEIEEVVVMMKEDAPSTSLTDGTEIYRGTKSQYKDNSTKTVNKTYYYTVFALDADGVPSAGVSTSYTYVVKEPHAVTYVKGAEDVTGDLPAAGSYKESFEFAVAQPGNLARSGYSFNGWNDGTGTYQPGDAYTMPDKAVEFTAQWRGLPTIPSTLIPATDISEMSSNASLNANNELLLDYNSKSAPSAWADFKVSAEGAGLYTFAINGYNNNGTGHQMTIEVFDANDQSMGVLAETKNWGNPTQIAMGSLELEAGIYRIRVTDPVEWAQYIVQSVVVTYKAPVVYDLPATLLAEDAVLAGGEWSCDDGWIKRAEVSPTTGSVTWKANVNKTGEYKVSMNISSSNGFHLYVTVYDNQDQSIGQLDISSGSGVKELGSITFTETGQYRIVVTNTTAWSQSWFKDLTFEYVKPTPTASFATLIKDLYPEDTYTQTVTTNSTGAVTYSSNNESVATVDPATGEVTAVAQGTATITAAIAATDDLKETSASYTISVLAAPVAGRKYYIEPGTDCLYNVIQNAQENDTVIFRDGTYIEDYSRTFNTTITLMADEGAHPILDISTHWIKATKGITIDGIEIVATDNYVLYLSGGSSDDMILRNVKINNPNAYVSIKAESTMNRLIIDNCVILAKTYGLHHGYNANLISITNSTFIGATYAALYLQNSTAIPTIIDHCTFYNNLNSGNFIVHLQGFNGSQTTVSNCVVYNTPASSGYAIVGNNTNKPTVTNCMINNCGTATYSTTNTNLWTDDPLIYVENGDYFYQNGSPIVGKATDGSNLGDPRWHAPTIIIDEEATDNTVLTENLDKTVDVQLVRSLTGGMFNTFCLPFDLSADQIAESDLADSRIITLDNTSLENQTLYFNFVEVETIEAGKPYLIQPLTDVVDPEFSNVTITADEATTQHVELVADFIPSFIVTEIPASESNLFLYLDNTLYYAGEATEMLGMRAYFHVIDPQQALLPARMRVGRSTPTGDEMVEEYIINDGTYQANGHVFIIHNGVRYNLFGQKM